MNIFKLPYIVVYINLKSSYSVPPRSCCNKIEFKSDEGINDNFPEFVGTYTKVDTDSTGKLYRKFSLF